jgi:hypothetical protein
MTRPVPQDCFPRIPVYVLLEVHQVVGPAPCLLASLGDQLGGQPGRRAYDVLIIDPQHLQGMRRAWGQGRGHLAGRQCRGTGTVPVLQRCGSQPRAVQRALAAVAGGEDRVGCEHPLPLFQAAPSLSERANFMPPGQTVGPCGAGGIARVAPGAPRAAGRRAARHRADRWNTCLAAYDRIVSMWNTVLVYFERQRGTGALFRVNQETRAAGRQAQGAVVRNYWSTSS